MWVLEDAEFHLQQHEVLSPYHTFSTIATLPISWSHFCVPQNPGTQPTFMFGKTMSHNPTIPTVDYNTNGRAPESWTATMWLESLPFFVQALEWLSTSSLRIYHVICHNDNIPHCTCPSFTKMPSQALGKKGDGWIANIFIVWLHIMQGGLQEGRTFTLQPTQNPWNVLD